MKDSIKSGIAQVIIAVIIFPYLAVILSLILDTATIKSVFINLLGEVDLFKYWINIAIDGSDVLYTKMPEYLNDLTSENRTINVVFEVSIMATCISICKNLLAFEHSINLYETLLGTIIGCFATKLLGDNLSFNACIFSAFLIADAIIYTIKKSHNYFISCLKITLDVTIQCMFTILSMGYIAILTLALLGEIPSIGTLFLYLAEVTIPFIILLIAETLLKKAFDD